MWDIDEKFEDYGRPNKKSYLKLNSDKPLSPYHISYPVTWTGYLNSKPIKVVQLGQSSSSTSDYEFVTFPEEDRGLMGDVAHIIDRKLHALLD